jgi:hypothetical protein
VKEIEMKNIEILSNYPGESKKNQPMFLQFLTACLFNCFWLIVPILLWNMIFQLPGKFSPTIFWHNIPPIIAYGENTFRMILILLPLLMPLRITTVSQKVGLIIYFIGIGIYFASWLVLMMSPGSAWSTSAIGFLAPTYTPIIWAVGIGLIGNRLYGSIPYRSWVYMIVTALFVIFHISHATLIFTRAA